MRDDKTKSTNELKDYSSTYENFFSLVGGDFSLQNVRDSLKKSPIETVHEYFQKKKKENAGGGDDRVQRFKADMDRHPARVRRLNELAVFANRGRTFKQFMKINSEVQKLLYGDKSGGGK